MKNLNFSHFGLVSPPPPPPLTSVTLLCYFARKAAQSLPIGNACCCTWEHLLRCPVLCLVAHFSYAKYFRIFTLLFLLGRGYRGSVPHITISTIASITNCIFRRTQGTVGTGPSWLYGSGFLWQHQEETWYLPSVEMPVSNSGDARTCSRTNS